MTQSSFFLLYVAGPYWRTFVGGKLKKDFLFKIIRKRQRLFQQELLPLYFNYSHSKITKRNGK